MRSPASFGRGDGRGGGRGRGFGGRGGRGGGRGRDEGPPDYVVGKLGFWIAHLFSHGIIITTSFDR